MTVVNPKSISGINSITTGSGSDNLLTIHTNDGTERVRVDSTGTTKIVTGIVTTLTATTGIVTTLTTNTLTANSTAKVGSGVTLSPDGDVFVTGVTTSTTVQVGGGVTISESGIEASGIGITVANINGGAVSGRRNMIINGDQRLAQRNTTAKLVTTDATYRCVDRFKTDIDGSSGGNFFHGQTGAGTSITADVPTGQGFTHSSKITVNASVSQPSGTDNRHQFYTMLEKQDVAHLEWGTSAAKTCTLSFWVKSSVAGTYILWIKFYGATAYHYYTNYTIDSANTWEKKVITLTGHTSGGNVSGTVTDQGFLIEWNLGTSSGNETGTLNEWTTSGTIRAASGSVYLPENAGATWYLTGVQFEVGSQATAFEHRSMAEELALCQRYFQQFVNICAVGYVPNNSSKSYSHAIIHPVEMRAAPTVSLTNTGSSQGQSVTDGENTVYVSSLLSTGRLTSHSTLSFNLSGDLTNYRGAYLGGTTNTANQTTISFNAEL